MPYDVAVDIGGTFTDLVAYDHSKHVVRYTKSPTTYDNFVKGILDCFRKAEIAPGDVNFVNHGTTLVINSLIQRRGAKTALVTTKGFRDVIEIARGNRPDPFDLYYRRDEPLVPRELRFEAVERIDADGQTVTPLDEAQLKGLCEELKNLDIESIGIFFINSYRNPAFEERAAALMRERLPGVYVTVSTDLTREWYEYERCSSVAANAYVGPQVSNYLHRLEGDLAERDFGGSLFMMGSNGGLLSVERTCRQPIALVESGPIGGCIGAATFADALGFDNVIAFDMGGTTAKCALVENGRFSVDSVYYVNGYIKGFPIKSPVIDIVEVGSGGGSIAWLDEEKRLHVGPHSAGSTPGPVCYGRSGAEPTVTDANLLLGRLNPDHFLGGELKLDTDAARDALSGKICAPLGYDGEESVIRMADGIISIATVIMASAIRKVSIEHGRDPRDFVMFAYGGGGPLHGSALAHELSIPTLVIPPEPGNFSAVGMLLADARIDASETFIGPLKDETLLKMKGVFAEMESEARRALKAEFDAEDVTFEHQAEMRFQGQRHNIKVALPDAFDGKVLRQAFLRDYERRYGHADAEAAIEIQVLHLSASARLKRPQIEHLPREATTAGPARNRPVYFGNLGKAADTPVYERAALAPGFTANGPAVIEEYGSTTIVWPGDSFEIGPMREIRIHCKAS